MALGHSSFCCRARQKNKLCKTTIRNDRSNRHNSGTMCVCVYIYDFDYSSAMVKSSRDRKHTQDTCSRNPGAYVFLKSPNRHRHTGWTHQPESKKHRRPTHDTCTKTQFVFVQRSPKRSRHSDWAHQAQEHIRNTFRHVQMHTSPFKFIEIRAHPIRLNTQCEIT